MGILLPSNPQFYVPTKLFNILVMLLIYPNLQVQTSPGTGLFHATLELISPSYLKYWDISLAHHLKLALSSSHLHPTLLAQLGDN
jgi:hypothetical protein